jgi:hypothetical protein
MNDFKKAVEVQEKHFNMMKIMMESKFPDLFETEVTFTPDQHSNTTLEVNQDLSFEEQNE